LKVCSAAGGAQGGGADRRAVSGGRLDEAALSLGAEPVAVAADVSTWLWCRPVEDRGGDHRIRKHGAPFGHAAVGRNQHGASFVAAADQLEEQMRRIGLCPIMVERGRPGQPVEIGKLGPGVGAVSCRPF